MNKDTSIKVVKCVGVFALSGALAAFNQAVQDKLERKRIINSLKECHQFDARSWRQRGLQTQKQVDIYFTER